MQALPDPLRILTLICFLMVGEPRLYGITSLKPIYLRRHWLKPEI